MADSKAEKTGDCFSIILMDPGASIPVTPSNIFTAIYENIHSMPLGGVEK